MNSTAVMSGTASRSSAKDRLEHTAIVIPTCNAVSNWVELRSALDVQGISADQVLIVDSSSTDNTRQLAADAGYRILEISREQFGHGRTRKMAAAQLPWADTLIYLTQDAIPCDERCFETLLDSFENDGVGAAYGRQLPREQADPIERHARLFNYPSASYVRDFSSRREFGFRSIYFSNSFAAYRRCALEDVGGFDDDALVSEEVSVAARMLMVGWKIAYNAEARVVHSHSFSISDEFCRYFDIAAEHDRERWMLEIFGKVGHQGRAFMTSQLNYLLAQDAKLIPISLASNLSKWCAYQLGIRQSYIPLWVKKHLSKQPNYWQKKAIRC